MERLLDTVEVNGSSPFGPTMPLNNLPSFCAFGIPHNSRKCVSLGTRQLTPPLICQCLRTLRKSHTNRSALAPSAIAMLSKEWQSLCQIRKPGRFAGIKG